MKEDNQNKSNHKSQNGLQKGLIIGLSAGAFLGFLIALFISDTLPFAESHNMLLGDMKGLVLIIYLYCVVGGAVLGLIVGLIIGAVVDYKNK